MGRVVAISGGELESTEKLNIYALKLSGKESPNVLFIGTASMYSEGYFAGIKAAFCKLNCSVKELPLTRGELDTTEIDARLKWADIIYVGGGDTRTLMVIPCCNPYSVNVKKRFWSIDNTDINRMFPGYDKGGDDAENSSGNLCCSHTLGIHGNNLFFNTVNIFLPSTCVGTKWT